MTSDSDPTLPSSEPTLMQQLRERLRRLGLRSTTPRLSVLEFLQQRPGPLTHAEIADGLEARGFDRTTVYRNLIALADVGLVLRTDLGDHVWRFELSREANAAGVLYHPHFLCEQCGDISCLHDTQVTITGSDGNAPTVIASVTSVLLRGMCDRCRT